MSELAYLKPSNLNNKSCILGIGKAFLLILLLSFLKSEMKRTVPFFLEIIKVGAAHLELFLHFNTPHLLIYQLLFLGNSLALYDLAPSKTSVLYTGHV